MCLQIQEILNAATSKSQHVEALRVDCAVRIMTTDTMFRDFKF
jgi:hypothetical protein